MTEKSGEKVSSRFEARTPICEMVGHCLIRVFQRGRGTLGSGAERRELMVGHCLIRVFLRQTQGFLVLAEKIRINALDGVIVHG